MTKSMTIIAITTTALVVGAGIATAQPLGSGVEDAAYREELRQHIERCTAMPERCGPFDVTVARLMLAGDHARLTAILLLKKTGLIPTPVIEGTRRAMLQEFVGDCRGYNFGMDLVYKPHCESRDIMLANAVLNGNKSNLRAAMTNSRFVLPELAVIDLISRYDLDAKHSD